MRIELETRLACRPESAWRKLMEPALLVHIASPLIRFVPIDPPALPTRWAEGRYRVAMRVLGMIPIGAQWVGLELPDGPEPEGWPRRVRDDGSGDLAKRWDHWIEIAPHPEGGTRYVDRVDVEAGWLTLGVWLFAQLFYRHRQSRWRRLAERELD